MQRTQLLLMKDISGWTSPTSGMNWRTPSRRTSPNRYIEVASVGGLIHLIVPWRSSRLMSGV